MEYTKENGYRTNISPPIGSRPIKSFKDFANKTIQVWVPCNQKKITIGDMVKPTAFTY